MEEQSSSLSNGCSAQSSPSQNQVSGINGIGNGPYSTKESCSTHYPAKEADPYEHGPADNPFHMEKGDGRASSGYPSGDVERSVYLRKNIDKITSEERGGMYAGKELSIDHSKNMDKDVYSSKGVGDSVYGTKSSGDICPVRDSGDGVFPAKNGGGGTYHPSKDMNKRVCAPAKNTKPKPDGTTSSTGEVGTPTKPPTPFRRQNRIDFPTIACKICGDRSSGVHYGIISCEGCKGFFRRCLRRKKEYICPKGGTCEISRHQRNRCPSCRYKKCIELGMSKEAVRIGRIPNKQKETEFVDIEPYVVEEFKDPDDTDIVKEIIIDEDTEKLIRTAGEAHKNTAKHYPEFNDYLSGKRKRRDLDESPISDSTFVEEAIKGMNGRELWSNVVSEALAMYIKRIVTFCKQIPGFTDLSQHDQMILVKAGFFEILTVQDTIELNLYNAFLLDKGLKISKSVMRKFMPPELQMGLYQFADRLHGRLKLNTKELALLSAIVLFSDDRENLNDQEAVARTQTKYLHALQMQLLKNHPKDSLMFAKVLLTLPILRTVDDLHNQFIMQLKIGVGETNTLPMPQLYKEVYDLPSKTGQAGACSGDHGPQNGKLPSTSQVVKTKEETKEYSSCQRSGGSSTCPSPAASGHNNSIERTHSMRGGSSTCASPAASGHNNIIERTHSLPADGAFSHHSGRPHSGNFMDHMIPEMSFRHHLGMAMAQGVRPPSSPGSCRQVPYSMQPYKHNSHSGAFRHQLSLEPTEHHGSCSHLSPSPVNLHQPSWSPEMERDYHILSRNIKKEAPDYDSSCL